eukprot:11209787-Lingulodinium_polyedra.AAC.1
MMRLSSGERARRCARGGKGCPMAAPPLVVTFPPRDVGRELALRPWRPGFVLLVPATMIVYNKTT